VNPLFNTELESKRTALVALCRKYGVSRLDLFGSGTAEDWRPGESDLDFVVAFHTDPHRSLADRYLGLAEELEALFGRSVDLLTDGAIRNPYFRRSVDSTRVPVYAE
jgi:hypothetical protein